jgi:hypothetical protein
MVKSKVMVSGAQANFLKAMLDSADKKYQPPTPNIANENPEEIEKVTKSVQTTWLEKTKAKKNY